LIHESNEQTTPQIPMTTRNVKRRLERLEAQRLPPSEEKVLIVKFVSADGEIVGTREFKLYGGPPLMKEKGRWR
jgi:hypothetical protein